LSIIETSASTGQLLDKITRIVCGWRIKKMCEELRDCSWIEMCLFLIRDSMHDFSSGYVYWDDFSMKVSNVVPSALFTAHTFLDITAGRVIAEICYERNNSPFAVSHDLQR
jgi:hypothetical protein